MTSGNHPDQTKAQQPAADVLTALNDFVTRLDALDPHAAPEAALTVRVGARETQLTLREPVARALTEALQAYRDPRDQGCCDHCGGRRIDNNFLCRDCGRPNGVFGQMLAERAARYVESAPLASTPKSNDSQG